MSALGLNADRIKLANPISAASHAALITAVYAVTQDTGNMNMIVQDIKIWSEYEPPIKSEIVNVTGVAYASMANAKTGVDSQIAALVAGAEMIGQPEFFENSTAGTFCTFFSYRAAVRRTYFAQIIWAPQSEVLAMQKQVNQL